MEKKYFNNWFRGFYWITFNRKIGSYEKYKVKALVLYNFGNDIGWLKTLDKNILNKIEIVHGDIRDYDLMLKVSKKQM